MVGKGEEEGEDVEGVEVVVEVKGGAMWGFENLGEVYVDELSTK